MELFSDLKLNSKILKAVKDAGYEKPTPIQEKAIPAALDGKDVLGIAQTGTGKTASFTLPMINLLSRGRARARMPRSLVLCPTRELAAQVAENFDTGNKLKTLSIGLPGSPDVEYAQKVADHIGSDHHVVNMSAEEFLASIRTVIYNIESYDTTSVRASVGNYLVSKYISENTNVKVVFNGDGADEVCMGYVYNINAPTLEDFHQENQ